ncbi:MAG: hypothetical protein ACK5QQ_15855, partial [Cyanobacteriota bacterium]
MPPTALISEQGCLTQQFGQHQPLAQILHGQQRFALAWFQLKSQAWGLAMGPSCLLYTSDAAD